MGGKENTSALRRKWMKKMKTPWKELKITNRYWKKMSALPTARNPNVQVRPRIGKRTRKAFAPCLY